MKTIRNRRTVTRVSLLAVILIGRLLYMYGSQTDRPSAIAEDSVRRTGDEGAVSSLADALMTQIFAESMRQSQQQRYNQQQGLNGSRGSIWCGDEYKQRQARERQIRQEEYIRQRARENYQKASPEERLMMQHYGF